MCKQQNGLMEIWVSTYIKGGVCVGRFHQELWLGGESDDLVERLEGWGCREVGVQAGTALWVSGL